jgi:MOSC domain-containing protein YiiM
MPGSLNHGRLKLDNPPSSGRSGHIFQISLSDGGVPKLGQPQAEVSYAGLVGDRHRDLKAHGGPEQALCLYSLERILALQVERHPLFPGAIGENLTIAGLDWSLVVPGARLRLGEHVLAEITRYTTPCSNIAPFFAKDDISRVSQKVHPSWSRLYARVLQPGMITVGDWVEII